MIITIDKAVMEQALAVLRHCLEHPDADDAIAALRSAIEQRGVSASVGQEPVAWMDDFGNAFPLSANKGAGSWMDEHKRAWKPLYTHPAQQAKPSITDEMILKAARELCKLESGMCQVDEHDNWKIYSDQFKSTVRTVLEAAHGIKE